MDFVRTRSFLDRTSPPARSTDFISGQSTGDSSLIDLVIMHGDITIFGLGRENARSLRSAAHRFRDDPLRSG
jgi:hypothetical protein